MFWIEFRLGGGVVVLWWVSYGYGVGCEFFILCFVLGLLDYKLGEKLLCRVVRSGVLGLRNWWEWRCMNVEFGVDVSNVGLLGFVYFVGIGGVGFLVFGFFVLW